MAHRPTRERYPALRGSTGLTGPYDWRSDETAIEAIAFMDEAAGAADAIITAELDRDAPSSRVLYLAGRLAFRAGLAKVEVLRLRGIPA